MPVLAAQEQSFGLGPELMQIERRKRLRAPLEWTVYLFRPTDPYPDCAKTRDLSSEGFYCIAHKPFTLGEWIECDIIVPVQHPQRRNEVLSLHCRAQVVRVEVTADGQGYGLACRIEDYSLVRHSQAAAN